jgi:hypothetical protein
MIGDSHPPFGALLRQHRLAASLSQEALAERARSALTEALVLSYSAGWLWLVADVLEQLAGLDDLADQRQLQVRLLGAAAALRERLGVPRRPLLQRMYEQTVRQTRCSLGDGWEIAWQAGHTLPLAQVIDAVTRMAVLSP